MVIYFVIVFESGLGAVQFFFFRLVFVIIIILSFTFGGLGLHVFAEKVAEGGDTLGGVCSHGFVWSAIQVNLDVDVDPVLIVGYDHIC